MVSASGLVTITGGKWTTYRRMAIDAVDHAAARGQPARLARRHRQLKLHGCTATRSDGGESFLTVYGSDAALAGGTVAGSVPSGTTAASGAALPHGRSDLGGAA